jgi:hypothetical protein
MSGVAANKSTGLHGAGFVDHRLKKLSENPVQRYYYGSVEKKF